MTHDWGVHKECCLWCGLKYTTDHNPNEECPKHPRSSGSRPFPGSALDDADALQRRIAELRAENAAVLAGKPA